MFSVAATAGTDQFGTAYPAGPAWNDAAGDRYSVGQRILTAAGQAVTATAGAAVAGLQTTVQAGAYYIRGNVTWAQGATAAAQNFWFNGPAASLVNVPFTHLQSPANATTPVTANPGVCTKIGSSGGASMPSPAFGGTDSICLWFEGLVTFTAAGTFGITCSEGTSGDPFTIEAGSYLVISPA
jgi:hypothetical protein